MNEEQYRQRLHKLEGQLKSIIRDEKLSDYEKELHISADIIIPLLDEIKEQEEEIVDEGWRREAEHADDWRKPVEMGQL